MNILFQPRFAELVRAGTKRQTVRPIRKLPLKPGQFLNLCRWSGLPYRSKQEVLARVVVTAFRRVDITETGIAVNSIAVPCDEFAKEDGFSDFFEFRDWFANTHGLPFEGNLIQW